MTGCLLDTDIAIYLRDGNTAIWERLTALGTLPALSVMTRIELEGGIVAVPELAARRRAALTGLLTRFDVLPADDRVADGYAAIVATCGYSRRKVIDRLIAATAIVNGLTLVTINGDDFRDIPGLALEAWPPPAQ